MSHQRAIPLLMLLANLILAASGSNGCSHFYPFDGNLSWRGLLDDCRLEQVYEGDKYLLRVKLPDTLEDYLTEECLDIEHPEYFSYLARRFEISARLAESERLTVTRTVRCEYRNKFQLSEKTSQHCNGKDEFEFQMYPCGEHKLSLTGMISGLTFFLGNKTLQLPFYPRPYQTEKKHFRVRLEFDPEMQGCFEGRMFNISCGKLVKRNVKLDEDLIVEHMFPGENHTCTLELPGLNQTVSLDIATRSLDYSLEELSPFSVHDSAVYMMRSMVKELLNEENIVVTVTVTDQDTKETFTVPGHVAVSSGIILNSARHYDACITVAQVESYFEPVNRTWCHPVRTLPPLRPHSGSLTAIWIFLTIIVIVLLALVILHFRRPDAVRALGDWSRDVRYEWRRLRDGIREANFPMNE